MARGLVLGRAARRWWRSPGRSPCGARRAGGTPRRRRGSCSIRPRRTRSRDEVAGRLATRLPKTLLGDVDALSSGTAGLASDAATAPSPTIARRAVSRSRRHASSVPSRVGDLERGFGVAARRRVAAWPSAGRAPPVGRAGSRRGTPRRGGAARSSVMVSPTTLPAARRARSATSARSSAIARCFSASISAAARSRIRSSSSRVAAMSRVARLLGDLLGARQDLVRLAARLGERGQPLGLGALAVLPRLLGVA